MRVLPDESRMWSSLAPSQVDYVMRHMWLITIMKSAGRSGDDGTSPEGTLVGTSNYTGTLACEERMTITKYIVARTVKEASSFWNSALCHDTQKDAEEYLNRCKLLGSGSYSNDVIFRCTLHVEVVAQ